MTMEIFYLTRLLYCRFRKQATSRTIISVSSDTGLMPRSKPRTQSTNLVEYEIEQLATNPGITDVGGHMADR